MSTIKISRRTFSAGILATTPLIMAGRAANAQGLKEISYITPFGHSAVYAPAYVAATDGHFEKNGLKVNIIPGNGSSAAVQQAVAGQVQVARTGGIDVVRAISGAKAPIRAVGTICHTSTWWIVSTAANPVKTPADLVGKTVGIVSAGGGSENTMDIVLTTAGVAHDSVKRQVVGNSPGALDLVKLGRIDAFICDQAVVVALRAMNAEVAMMSVDPYVAIPGQVYLASQKTIDEQPEIILAFLKSIRSAVNQIADDASGDQTLAAMKPFNFPELSNPAAAKATVRAELNLWLARGRDNICKIMPDAWEKGWAQMVSAGLATQGDPSLAYTTKFSKQL